MIFGNVPLITSFPSWNCRIRIWCSVAFSVAVTCLLVGWFLCALSRKTVIGRRGLTAIVMLCAVFLTQVIREDDPTEWVDRVIYSVSGACCLLVIACSSRSVGGRRRVSCRRRLPKISLLRRQWWYRSAVLPVGDNSAMRSLLSVLIRRFEFLQDVWNPVQ